MNKKERERERESELQESKQLGRYGFGLSDVKTIIVSRVRVICNLSAAGDIPVFIAKQLIFQTVIAFCADGRQCRRCIQQQ